MYNTEDAYVDYNQGLFYEILCDLKIWHVSYI